MRRRPLGLTAGLGVALLSLTGCPGDDTTPADGSSSSSSGSSTSPDPTLPNTMTMPPADSSGTSTSGGSDSTTTAPTGSGSTTSVDPTTGSTSVDPTTGSTSVDPTTGSTSVDPTTGSTSVDPTTTGLGTSSSSTSGVGSVSSGVVFILPPDIGMAECDLWLQDCPVGEKCMPFDSGSGTWDDVMCTAIDAAPGQPGDACTVSGTPVSGIDTCDEGVMCWDVDGMTLAGTCVEMCSGSEAAPVCTTPGTSCAIANGGLIIVCLPGCDPLLQDCAVGEACYPVAGNFLCAPDASGPDGVDGDECLFLNVCDPGLYCEVDANLEGCPFASCCTPFCDVTEIIDPCPAATEECVPFFELGSAPPGLEDVGACIVPPPP